MNTILKILLVADGLLSLSGGLLGPIYAIFVESIGGDILDASLMQAVHGLYSHLLQAL